MKRVKHKVVQLQQMGLYLSDPVYSSICHFSADSIDQYNL